MTASNASNPLALRPADLEVARSQTDWFLLDGSGSMMGENWLRCVAAIDAYVDGLKLETVQSHMTLQVFDTMDLELLHRQCTLNDWVPLHREAISAHWGQTPLYDAINLVGWRLRDLDPERASLVILTDGDENASRHTTLDQAAAILRWMEAKGWQVTFIGCDFANHKLAKRLGLRESQAIGVQKALLVEAAQSLARKRAQYGRTGAPMHWTEAEQQQFGGYLAPPKSVN